MQVLEEAHLKRWRNLFYSQYAGDLVGTLSNVDSFGEWCRLHGDGDLTLVNLGRIKNKLIESIDDVALIPKEFACLFNQIGRRTRYLQYATRVNNSWRNSKGKVHKHKKYESELDAHLGGLLNIVNYIETEIRPMCNPEAFKALDLLVVYIRDHIDNRVPLRTLQID